MKSLSFIQDIRPDALPVVPLLPSIGTGADGEVFEIQNDPHKVIKCAILYEYHIPIHREMERIEAVAKYLIANSPSEYVRVHEFASVAESFRKTVSGDQKYNLYYYIMDKCYKISEDEKKVFHSILSNEDNNLRKNYSKSKVSSMLAGMSMGFDFDMKKILAFHEAVQNSVIDNTDINSRNIMKTLTGEFKLVDFDRSSI